MADVMKLNVITPDKQFYTGDVTMVEMTTTEGNIGVYPNHIPLTAVAAPGVLTIHEEGEKKEASLISGFVTILPDSVYWLVHIGVPPIGYFVPQNGEQNTHGGSYRDKVIF